MSESRKQARINMFDQILHGYLGNMFTKRFLKSKNVIMVSEGDFIARLRICVRTAMVLPFYLLYFCAFLYFGYAVSKEQGQLIHNSTYDEMYKLYDQQRYIIFAFTLITVYHVVLISFVFIVMMNMTMNKATTVVTAIFNALYISEQLFFASLIFILKWVGLFDWIHPGMQFDTAELGSLISTNWLWVFVYILAAISFRHLKHYFREINVWNREWIRIERYRKTEDKENAFIFKSWVSPGEIKARHLMIGAASFCIFAASIMHVCDILGFTSYTVVKFMILFFGYAVFVCAYTVPYNKISLIFFWGCHIFILGLFVYAMYVVQNLAWKAGNAPLYAYLSLFIPWAISLSSAIHYTWTIKDKEEIRAIVLNEFTSQDDFEEYLENRETNDAEVETALNV